MTKNEELKKISISIICNIVLSEGVNNLLESQVISKLFNEFVKAQPILKSQILQAFTIFISKSDSESISMIVDEGLFYYVNNSILVNSDDAGILQDYLLLVYNILISTQNLSGDLKGICDIFEENNGSEI